MSQTSCSPAALLASALLLTLTGLTTVLAADDAGKWAVVPGAEAACRALVEKAEAGGVSADEWQAFVKEHGAPSLHLILAMLAEPNLRLAAQEGFRHYLGIVPPAAAAPLLAALEEPRKTEMRWLLEQFGRQAATVHVLSILQHLKDYKTALRLARDAWEQAPDIRLIRPAAEAVRQGQFHEEMWSEAGQQLYRDHNAKRQLRRLSFYVHLAAALRQVEKVPALVTLAAPEPADSEVAQSLANTLTDMGFEKEAQSLLGQAADDPVLRYMTLRGDSEEPMPDAEWEKVVETLTSEGQCLQMIQQMAKENQPARQMQLWWRVLELDPKESVNDARALLAIAQNAQAKAEYTRAADYYQQLLDLIGKTNLAVRPERLKEWQETIDKLRQQAADDPDGFAAALQLGRQEMLAQDYAAALKHFEKAVTVRPEDPQGWLMLYENCKAGSYFQRGAAAVEQLLKLTPDNDLQRLAWSQAALENGRLDTAEALLKATAEALHKEPRFLAAQAALYERQGRYEEAVTALETAVEHGAETADVYRALGVACAQAGKLEAAAKHFDRALSSNISLDYCRLWLHFVRGRLGQNDLADFAMYLAKRGFKGDEWPAQMIAYAMGEITAEELLARATRDVRPEVGRAQSCEAWFCVGQKRLANGDEAGAVKAFQQCLAQGILPFVETVWARAELKRLGGLPEG